MDMSKPITKIIVGGIAIIFGLVLMPVIAYYIYMVGYEHNATGVRVPRTDVTNISGLTSVVQLVGYGFAFGLVGMGVGLVYTGFKGKGK